jgi:glutamate-ammonia-ligase adenylyltransferase
LSPAKPPIDPEEPFGRGVPSGELEKRSGESQASSDSLKVLCDAVANIPFQNPESAKIILAHAAKQVSPSMGAALPGLLAESPDPDSALILFDRFISESQEIVHLLDRHNVLAHYAVVVFGHSRFLGETLIRNPDILQSFLKERNLDRSFAREDFQESLSRFRSRSFETDVSLLLARFKRREYLRIMLRDVLKIAPLAETTSEISALADVLIEETLRDAESVLQRRYGTPQHLDAEGRLVDTRFSVLSLGKLGGNELNYSSDVDLLYIFSDGQESPGATITNREYFVRLSQHITEALSRVTREGPVFRIDLRLRPQGNEGELAISLETALRYYTVIAHDWERQALIKIRHSAGDISVAREFIRRVQPQVYGEEPDRVDYGSAIDSDPAAEPDPSLKSGGFREQTQTPPVAAESDPSLHPGFRQWAPATLTPTKRLNFAAIKTALVAREKIQKHRYAQRAQRSSHGVIDVKLDHGGIRDIEFLVQCLQRVHGGAEPWLRSGGTLFSLQKLHDKQHISGKEFHNLTAGYEFLRHLEHRMQLRQGQQTHRLPSNTSELNVLRRSMEGYDPREYQIADLVSTVRRRMAAVAEIYQHVIYQQQSRSRVESLDIGFTLHSGPEPTSSDQSNQQILERLAQDAAELHQAISKENLGGHARKNLFRFLSSALTSSRRYAEVTRNARGVIRALALFEASDYLTDILIRYPDEIATLTDLEDAIPRVNSGYLFASPLGCGRATTDPVFEYVARSNNPHGDKLALLRKHFRHRILAVGARDITALCGVYESLDSTTAAAEDAIAAAVATAGNPDGLAVMAVGRLGSREMDVLSDADLLFVGEKESGRGALTKSAEQVMQALSAYTRDGMVFPVDTRLRPRGGAGDLLITPTQLATYFEQEAQPWEALMYTKLRFVAGSAALGDEAMRLADRLYRRYAIDPGFLDAAREMRDKLATAGLREKNLKTSPGAAYDIDFLSGFLLVKHGIQNKQGSLRDRLWRCAAAGLLEYSDAAQLDHAAEFLRTVEHVVRLVTGRAQKWLPAAEHAQEATEKLTSQILSRHFANGLEAELLRTFADVRSVYNRVLRKTC